MGELVELEAPPKSGPGPRRKPSQKPQRRRPRRSKTALVLGGGGFTGGVYEIGALRALDLLTVNRTVNDFDVYVGTSAGAFVATLVASGFTPEEMSRVVNRQVPTPFRDVDLGTLTQHLGYLMRRAQLWIFQDFIRTLAVLDIRPAQYSVLMVIEHNPGLTQSRASAALGIKRTNFVVLLDGLESRGLAERRPAASDRH